MQESHIIIKDLEFFGYHGVYPEEAVTGTEFKVDIDILLDPGLVCFESDELADALNYEEVIAEILQIGTQHRYQLIEKLSAVMADAVMQHKEARRVQVTVKKLVRTLTEKPQWLAVSFLKARV